MLTSLIYSHTHTVLSVQFRLPGTQPELSVSEDAGVVSNLLFIEKVGQTGQSLTVRLEVDTESDTIEGMLNLLNPY